MPDGQRNPTVSPPPGERYREGAPLRLGILASHAGTTMQAIIDAREEGRLQAEVRVVIGNNSRSGALERARTHGIPAYHLSGVTHPDPGDLDEAVLELLTGHGVNIVALAGYMKRLGPLVLSHFRGRLINTHPALLPKFGGQGMYGDRVHEAVLTAGEKVIRRERPPGRRRLRHGPRPIAGQGSRARRRHPRNPARPCPGRGARALR